MKLISKCKKLFVFLVSLIVLCLCIPCIIGYHLGQGVADLESFQQINFDMVESTDVM